MCHFHTKALKKQMCVSRAFPLLSALWTMTSPLGMALLQARASPVPTAVYGGEPLLFCLTSDSFGGLCVIAGQVPFCAIALCRCISILMYYFLFFSFFSFFFFFKGCTHGLWKLPGWGQFRAAAASLRHSHSNSRFEPHL